MLRVCRIAFITGILLLPSVIAGAVNRDAPVNYIFTTQVLKINRTSGQMILKYSEAGKAGMRKDRIIQLNNYDNLDIELTARVNKIHDSKPWIIIEVLSGEYREIEKGFRYRTQFIKGTAEAEADEKEDQPKAPSEG